MSTAILRFRETASRGTFKRKRDVPLLLSVGVLVLLVLGAVFAPLIAPYDPTASDFMRTYRPIEPGAILGTDSSGRDIFSRILHGGRVSLVAPAVIVIVAGLLGTVIGIASAVAGGVVDRVLSRVLDIGFAFPGMLLAILAVTMFGAGATPVVVALAIAYVPFIGRMVRNVAVGEMSLPYVDALFNVGQSRWAIAVRHILPAVLPTAMAQVTVSYGYAMVDLAAMSFLGMGVQPPTADWGLMVSEGQQGVIQGRWEETVAAGLVILASVAAVSMIGDRYADRVGSVRETKV
ncbi:MULTISPECIES: ABC transporter permease [unclassified Leucobacter]|uniref:ABC transporter permease n=1 Tax=unclassified Leucobacter TaxID=2621730 RepID=UPI00165E1773|nr:MULTISPECIES: ABC transporter permease [unclassified Leucobacter]MBC9936426.1 ABC transporter permease [Leucobacter sp. cx-87]